MSDTLVEKVTKLLENNEERDWLRATRCIGVWRTRQPAILSVIIAVKFWS